MLILTGFSQSVSIILYIMKNKDSGYISANKICEALSQFPASSLKKNITKLVNSDLLVSVSGPHGGVEANPKMDLAKTSLKTIFIISEEGSDVSIEHINQINLFNSEKELQSFSKNTRKIFKDSFNLFLKDLDKYTLKDLLKSDME